MVKFNYTSGWVQKSQIQLLYPSSSQLKGHNLMNSQIQLHDQVSSQLQLHNMVSSKLQLHDLWWVVNFNYTTYGE